MAAYFLANRSGEFRNGSCSRTWNTKLRSLSHRINVRKPHENGDAESAHGHLKSWLDQALRLRGSRDFTAPDEYLAFLRQVVARRNQTRALAFRKECEALERLPLRRVKEYLNSRKRNVAFYVSVSAAYCCSCCFSASRWGGK